MKQTQIVKNAKIIALLRDGGAIALSLDSKDDGMKIRIPRRLRTEELVLCAKASFEIADAPNDNPNLAQHVARKILSKVTPPPPAIQVYGQVESYDPLRDTGYFRIIGRHGFSHNRAYFRGKNCPPRCVPDAGDYVQVMVVEQPNGPAAEGKFKHGRSVIVEARALEHELDVAKKAKAKSPRFVGTADGGTSVPGANPVPVFTPGENPVKRPGSRR